MKWNAPLCASRVMRKRQEMNMTTIAKFVVLLFSILSLLPSPAMALCCYKTAEAVADGRPLDDDARRLDYAARADKVSRCPEEYLYARSPDSKASCEVIPLGEECEEDFRCGGCSYQEPNDLYPGGAYFISAVYPAKTVVTHLCCEGPSAVRGGTSFIPDCDAVV